MKKSVPIKLFAIAFIIFICIFILNILFSAKYDLSKQNKDNMTQAQLNGRVFFESYCVSCHGNLGAGDGSSSITLAKLPPNFLNEKETFVNGFSESGLIKTINEGVPNSQMPKFNYLPQDVKKNIVEYLLYLRKAKRLK